MINDHVCAVESTTGLSVAPQAKTLRKCSAKLLVVVVNCFSWLTVCYCGRVAPGDQHVGGRVHGDGKI